MEELQEKLKALLQKDKGTWAIVLEDLDKNTSIKINEEHQYNASSIIKLPILAAAFSQVDKGELSLNQSVKLTRQDMVGGSGVLQHLSAGLTLNVYDLLMLMIIQSDNTATNMIIDLIGKQTIQDTVQQLGMESSGFYNKLMIVPVDRESSNTVTAKDVNELLKQLVYGDFSSFDACRRMIKIMKQQQLHYLTELFPDPEGDVIGTAPAWEFASKTGNVTGVYHDVGIMYVWDRTCLISVLSEQTEHEQAMQVYKEIGSSILDYMYRQ